MPPSRLGVYHVTIQLSKYIKTLLTVIRFSILDVYLHFGQFGLAGMRLCFRFYTITSLPFRGLHESGSQVNHPTFIPQYSKTILNVTYLDFCSGLRLEARHHFVTNPSNRSPYINSPHVLLLATGHFC